MKHWGLTGLMLVVLLGGALRWGDLSGRLLHNDEAVNAFKLRGLWEEGRYRYDPDEYHGPVLYYFSLPVVGVVSWVQPDQPDVAAMRLTVLLAGLALIVLLVLLADGLGWPAVVAAGAWTAVSPAMVYFSRYYIHEMFLVLFTLLAMGGAWRYVRRPSLGWAGVTGAALGLMYAAKETFVFAVAAAGVAAVVLMLIARRRVWLGAGAGWGGWVAVRWRRHLAMAVGMAVLVWVLFFSSFLTHPSGPLDALRTYWIWLERAGGSSPHVHPWYFYFQRLGWFQERGGPLWTEAAIWVLAGVGVLGVWRGWGLSVSARWMGGFLAVYTVVLAGMYSVIPYKTPWCFLGFHHGALLLAGLGTVVVWQVFRPWPWKVLMAAGLIAAAGHLTVQSRRATGEYAGDFRNPHVYGHTSWDVVNLLERMDELVAAHPEGRAMSVEVAMPEHGYWPLPWYWRHLSRVAWRDALPDGPRSTVVVVGHRLQANVEEATQGAWQMVGNYEFRPRVFVEVYVEAGFWKRFLEGRTAARAAHPTSPIGSASAAVGDEARREGEEDLD